MLATRYRSQRDIAWRDHEVPEAEPTQTEGAPGPTLQMADVAGPRPSATPAIVTAGVPDPKPVELTDAEAAVLKWCGHQWQPGVAVGIARGALEMGMSALQVAQVVDGLHFKRLVSKVGRPLAATCALNGVGMVALRRAAAAIQGHRSEQCMRDEQGCRWLRWRSSG